MSLSDRDVWTLAASREIADQNIAALLPSPGCGNDVLEKIGCSEPHRSSDSDNEHSRSHFLKLCYLSME